MSIYTKKIKILINIIVLMISVVAELKAEGEQKYLVQLKREPDKFMNEKSLVLKESSSTLNSQIISAENNKPFILNCTTNDTDIAYIWLQGPNADFDVTYDDRVQSIDNGKSILFTYIVSTDEDTYTCVGDFNNGTFKKLSEQYLFVKS